MHFIKAKIFQINLKISILLLLAVFVLASTLRAQEQEKVELERADILEKKPNVPNAKKLKNNVVVRHKGSILYCDSAYLYEDKNRVEAFGNARLISDNGTTVTSKKMTYDGNTQVASAIGEAVLVDEKMTLNTEELDYDVARGVAFYMTQGKIVDQENTLTSESGTYDSNSKIFYFKKNVELINQQDGRKVNTDDLTYNTISKIAYFKGPTKLTSKDGVLYTNEGEYNTETKISNFKGRSKIDNPDYYMEGDSLYYDNLKRIGFAKGNVYLQSKKDTVFINGDIGRFRGEEGFSVVYGNALMRNVSKGDTLYLTADTLVSINNKEKNIRMLKAYLNAKVYNKDFQGKADSLVYNRNDSTFYLYRDPVLWNDKSQITADTVIAQMANNKIQKMYLNFNSFMVTMDTLKNFNQLKGKKMIAYFKDNKIKRLQVFGNSENIYFALKEDTTFIGMNRVECSDMDIQFVENNKIHKVSYINKPDAIFVPPHELQEPQKKLKDFKWRLNERPDKEQMLKRAIFAMKPKKY